ncbi:MAG: hypothetical protein ACJAYU_003160 [Bradymonadia bacterium]|jgi:hypothetical protein
MCIAGGILVSLLFEREPDRTYIVDYLGSALEREPESARSENVRYFAIERNRCTE